MIFKKKYLNPLLGGLFLCISACSTTKTIRLQQAEGVQQTIDSSLAVNSEIEQIIAPYRSALSSKMQEIIGYNQVKLTKEQPESNLGNFCADAILYTAQKHSIDTVHAAITNFGGMRIPSIEVGDIKLGTIYELMPFDNTLVVLNINGEVLIQFLNHSIASGGWPISEEISIKADTLNSQYSFKINSQNINPNQEYRICTSDYLANGGDNCAFLKTLEYEALDILFRDGLLQFIENKTANNAPIEFVKQNRFEYAE